MVRLLAREDPSLVDLGPPPHPDAVAVALPDGARERPRSGASPD